MMIACPSCQTKYSLADDKVRAKTVSIRCRQCQTTIVAGGPSKSESPPLAATPTPAAILKRGGARGGKRDLFGEPPPEPPPPPAVANATAQRHDESVLFTLAGLTRKPLVDVARGSSAGHANNVNSGLIDLTQMRTAPAQSIRTSIIQPLFPFPSTPPLGMSMEIPPPTPTNRRNLFIAIGGGIAVLALVGFGIGSGGETKASAATSAPPARVAVTAPPPAVVAAPSAVSSSPSAATSTTSVDSLPLSSKGTASSGKGKGKHAGNGVVRANSSPKIPKITTTKSRAGDPCGCRGELMCLMRCSK